MLRQTRMRLLLALLLGVIVVARAGDGEVVTPSDLKWTEVPSYPGVKFAVLSGSLSKPGPFTVRAKFPPNYELGPHTHSDDRTLTILEGSWKQGAGDKLDAAAAVPMPQGAFVVIPAKRVHFDISGPEGAIVQVTGSGGSLTEYLEPADDAKQKYK